MKKYLKSAGIIFATVLLGACGGKTNNVKPAIVDSMAVREAIEMANAIAETKRQELRVKAHDEGERLGKRVVELAAKQEKAQAKAKEAIGKEIEVLNERRAKLDQIFAELGKATKESLAAYEKRIIDIIKETK
jgi:hypothetical protein